MKMDEEAAKRRKRLSNPPRLVIDKDNPGSESNQQQLQKGMERNEMLEKGVCCLMGRVLF